MVVRLNFLSSCGDKKRLQHFYPRSLFYALTALVSVICAILLYEAYLLHELREDSMAVREELAGLEARKTFMVKRIKSAETDLVNEGQKLDFMLGGAKIAEALSAVTGAAADGVVVEKLKVDKSVLEVSGSAVCEEGITALSAELRSAGFYMPAGCLQSGELDGARAFPFVLICKDTGSTYKAAVLPEGDKSWSEKNN